LSSKENVDWRRGETPVKRIGSRSRRVWRHRCTPTRSRPNMPTPLQLNDDEMSVLLSLAGPIDQQRLQYFIIFYLFFPGLLWI
jgi:hypothetical protein